MMGMLLSFRKRSLSEYSLSQHLCLGYTEDTLPLKRSSDTSEQMDPLGTGMVAVQEDINKSFFL